MIAYGAAVCSMEKLPLRSYLIQVASRRGSVNPGSQVTLDHSQSVPV
jgi:hypothetical protein